MKMEEIDRILDKVNEYIKQSQDGIFLHANMSQTGRPYIFIYLNGSNHLDYEFKENSWIIHLDLNYGHRKVIGEIKGYNKVEYKQDLWKKIPEPIKKHIENLNKIFKESLKSESIKFITSKVKEKLGTQTFKLYRKDNSTNFSVNTVRPNLGKVKIDQYRHKPQYLMTYLPGIYATPSKDYAEKYPQENLYALKVTGNFFELPKDFDKIKGETLDEVTSWLKNNYDGVIGRKAASTNYGKYDEVVIFNKSAIKNVKEIK